jgi:hypothetical protein|tara:strand:- start:584 stop:1024 length:441 start_codon:yes stop_codon:yes gene_type:complete
MKLGLTPKQKKDVFILDVEQAILVPSTAKADKKIPDAKFKSRVAEVRKYLSQKFGGYTSIKGVGGYYSEPKRKVIQEKVTKVTGFATTQDFKKNKPALIKQLGAWGKEWGQESIGYEHEGDLYYFPQAKKNKRKAKLKAKLRRKKK